MIKKIIFIPDIKIKTDQLNPINNVCPKSGCITNSDIINNVNKREKINFKVELDNLLLEIIRLKIITKKGLTSSIGCNLGKKNKSNHLFDPFTSIPKNNTANKVINITKKIGKKNFLKNQYETKKLKSLKKLNK